MKQPDKCSNITEIRAEIDALDRQVIALLGKRFQYVKSAATFKTSATEVNSPERFQAMLKQRHQWAEDEGLNGDAISQLYEDLVNHFIAEEMQHWQAQQQ